MVGNEKGHSSEVIYEQIEEICDELDADIINREKLMDFVQSETFSNILLHHPWNDPKKLTTFLRIIIAVKKYAVDDRPSILAVYDKVLKSDLLKTAIAENIPKMKESSQRNRILAKLFHYIIEILLFGYENHLTKMDDYESDVGFIVTSLKPMDALLEMTKEKFAQLDVIYTAIQKRKAEMAQKKARAQFHNQKFSGNRTLPPENYREIPLIPSIEELAIDFQPYLREAKIFEPYFNTEHYLDVHFRLLREDMISPLRIGIEEVKTGKSHMHCYKHVKISEVALYMPSSEYIHYVKIHETQQKLCKKTLKHSSLLCLSSDKFQTEYFFAYVADREECLVLDGKVGIKFEEQYDIDFTNEYLMVESPAFFEAYRHVLAALQNIPPCLSLPFQKYLIHGRTKTRLPGYTDGSNLYDFSCILTDGAKETLATKRFTVSEIKKVPLENVILNESQFDAFTYALETEIALIQGPPGTGKSYIGLQLAKFFLDGRNWFQWNYNDTPLLVVCYTNHALDQFLKGICDFAENKIVRVGSQCKDRVLVNFTMQQWRKKFSDSNHWTLLGHCKRLEREIVKFRWHLKQLNSGLASREAMLFTSDTEFHTDERFIEWLTLWKPERKLPELDVEVVRQLVDKGVKEKMAREAYASVCSRRKKDEDGNLVEIDVDDLYERIKRKHFYIGMYPTYTRHWPMLKDIDEVMSLGYSAKVAITLLQNSRMNVRIIREECRKFPVKLVKKFQLLDNDGEEDFEDDPIMQAKKDAEKERLKQERKLPAEVEELGDYIRSVPKMEDDERMNITDVWKLSLQKRWRLYQHYVSEAIKLTKGTLKEHEEHYYFYKNQVIELNKELDKEILRNAKVIGMTTTGAAKYQSYLEELKPAIVLAEEAAEVMEAHIFTSLTSSCQQLILIGDHQQLRPRLAEYKLTDYNLDVSLFERLVKNGCSHKMLTTQHRMRPEISSMMQKHFYDDLLNSETVFSRPHVKGLTKDVVYIQHSYPEVYKEEEESRKNTYEFHYAIYLAKYIRQQGYKSKQIAILCTYAEQRYNLRRVARNMLGDKHNLKIENVDNFQGEEADIIILSLVRSESENGKIGYLNIKNRICVALSRARIGMYVIGNIDYLAHAASTPLWSEIRCTLENEDILSDKLTTKCQKHGTEQIIQNYKDFELKCPEGGCQVRCNDLLQCGHNCALFCHGYDMEHIDIICHEPCPKICLHGVPCKKLCGEECDPCESCEDGNCYYFPVESNDSSEGSSEVVEAENVVGEVYSRSAEISFFLDGADRPKFRKK